MLIIIDIILVWIALFGLGAFRSGMARPRTSRFSPDYRTAAAFATAATFCIAGLGVVALIDLRQGG